jgi:MerR family transcriptional regulator, light-induced transcriptional regulator
MTLSLFSIAETEQETGISRDTLRVWERRYGFPAPLRNQRGERCYHPDHLNRLRLCKQLLDRGQRPGTFLTLSDDRLRELLSRTAGTASRSADLEGLLETLSEGVGPELHTRMEALLRQYGLGTFLTDVVAPLNHAVGDAWCAGQIGILNEHVYTEHLLQLLNSAVGMIPSGTGSPKVLLTTLPGELHGIGLLMVTGMLRLEGAEVLSLGVQMPLEEIVRGAVEGQCRIVGISCSEHMGRRTIASQLVRLRRLLPMGIALWVGGSGVHTIRSLAGDIRLFNDLSRIPSAIRENRFQPSEESNG